MSVATTVGRQTLLLMWRRDVRLAEKWAQAHVKGHPQPPLDKQAAHACVCRRRAPGRTQKLHAWQSFRFSWGRKGPSDRAVEAFADAYIGGQSRSEACTKRRLGRHVTRQGCKHGNLNVAVIASAFAVRTLIS